MHLSMTRINGIYTTTLLVLLVVMQTNHFCFGNFNGAESLVAVLYGGASALAEHPSVEQEEKRRQKLQRIKHVRHVLNERLLHVQKGKRDRDFAAWLKKRGNDMVVFSMHGSNPVDLPPSSTTRNHTETASVATVQQVENGDNLFSRDIMDLDLVLVDALPSLYPGKPVHLLDERHPSVIQLAMRALRLGVQFAPITCTMWLAFLSSKFRERYWYGWIASCLASSGPAFIKWGQWASTREDMFPSTLCNALSQLHNEAPSHSWSFTKKTMESSLGLPYDSLYQVFESIDTTPIASGSIAQVHRAVLKHDYANNNGRNNNGNANHDGTLVAVKVRHPRVSQLIDMDFRLMSLLARIADSLPALRWLHIQDSVEQFSHTMAAQAHLNVEAHHLEVLNYNFRKWPHVKFPQPFYASSSVIMETFEPGQIITNVLDHYDAIAKNLAAEKGTLTVEEVMDIDENEDTATNNGNPKEGEGYQLVPMKLARFIVTTGLSLYLKMLLVDNVMHADLHPGNMMVDIHRNDSPPSRKSSSKALVPTDSRHRPSPAKERFGIVLVDAGMVAQLTEKESVNFIGLLSSLGEGDGKSAGEFALRFSSDGASELSSEQREAFVQDMVTLFADKCKGYGTDVDVGEVLRGVLSLVRKHHVRISANYATLVVNCLCMEGLGRRVCPSYNVLDAAKPILQRFRKMCVNKNGIPKDVIRQNGLQQGLTKLWMPMLYFQKTVSDNRFFRHQEREFRKNGNNGHQ